jgi:hypothetical protein
MTTEPKRRGRPPSATKREKLADVELLKHTRSGRVLALHAPGKFAARQSPLSPHEYKLAAKFFEARGVRREAIVVSPDLSSIVGRLS